MTTFAMPFVNTRPVVNTSIASTPIAGASRTTAEWRARDPARTAAARWWSSGQTGRRCFTKWEADVAGEQHISITIGDAAVVEVAKAVQAV